MSWSFKLFNRTKDGAKKAVDAEAAKPHSIPRPVADQIKASIDQLPDAFGDGSVPMLIVVGTNGHLAGGDYKGSSNATFEVGYQPLGE